MKLTQNVAWWDRAISQSEMISNGFEVFKAWLARFAEWILFFCLIANIIEIFPLPEPFASIFGNIVLGIQVITLDVAGFGLASMGASARRRGDRGAARKASRMGWTLISIMMLTVGLVAISVIAPSVKSDIDVVQKALILVRVIVTVLYSHIVHSLRVSGTEHEDRVQQLENDLSAVQRELATKQSELSSVQQKVSSGQQEIGHLRKQLDTLAGQMDSKQQEIGHLRETLDTGQDFHSSRLSSLQREVEREQAERAALQRELYTAKAELERVQFALSTEQQIVSSLRKEVSSVQRQGAQSSAKKVSSGQVIGHPRVDAGQAKVVQLDSRRREQDEVEKQIRTLHTHTPVQSLSARGIAGQVGCSPTTAAKWKAIIESEDQPAANE